MTAPGAAAVAGNCDGDKDSKRRKGGPRPCEEANPGRGAFEIHGLPLGCLPVW